ncbi:MAG: DUF2807 domain-containing protein [Lachnospiraceae bacterium]|nr:DUF2807 domain-containing protein [Lachnospiraceae bacterium]
MNIKSTTLSILLALTACLGCQAATITPSKNYVTKKVSAEAFTSIRTYTALDVEYTVGARSVEVYAPDNLIDYIKISVANGELRISYKEDMNIRGDHKSVVRVSAPEVSEFTTSSAGDITIKSPIKLKNAHVKLTAMSAGDIKAQDIEAASVRLMTNSAGDIVARNIKADEAKLVTNSAGDIEAECIAVKDKAEISSNSAGDIEVEEVVAGKSVKASANSAGDIEIDAMNTSSASLSANSAGDIKAKNLKANDVRANASSAGKVTMTGNCATAELEANGHGDINASSLKANHVTATARSIGSITCNALQSLNASRYGRGSIKWAGNPSDVTIEDPKGNGVTKL